MLAGECFCRAVGYAVADAFEYALNCHCSNCRRATGSAFKPFAGIARDKLSITSGDDNADDLWRAEASHDVHCARCGSLLYSVVRDGAFVHVAMGTLVDAPSIRPSAHIFVGSKAPWFAITDDLPQYQEHHVRAERPLREYMLAAAGLYPLREPGRKTDRPWAEPPGARPTNEEARARFTCAWFVT